MTPDAANTVPLPSQPAASLQPLELSRFSALGLHCPCFSFPLGLPNTPPEVPLWFNPHSICLHYHSLSLE